MKVFKPEDLLNFGAAPTNEEAFSEWVNQSDMVDFLCDDLQDPDIILHASFDTLLLNSVLAPADVLSELTPKALSSWSHDNSSGWSVCEGMGRDNHRIVFPRADKRYGDVNKQMHFFLSINREKRLLKSV